MAISNNTQIMNDLRAIPCGTKQHVSSWLGLYLCVVVSLFLVLRCVSLFLFAMFNLPLSWHLEVFHLLHRPTRTCAEPVMEGKATTGPHHSDVGCEPMCQCAGGRGRGTMEG